MPVSLTPEVDEDADVPMLSMDPPLQYIGKKNKMIKCIKFYALWASHDDRKIN